MHEDENKWEYDIETSLAYDLLGKIVSRPIYSKKNVLLLCSNVVLTKRLISLLFKNDVQVIYIKNIR